MEVDENVDLVFSDETRGRFVAEFVDTLEMIHRADDSLANRGTVLARPAIAVDLEFASIVQLEELRRQHRHGVQAEVRRQVGNAQPLVLVDLGRRHGLDARIELLLDVVARGGPLRVRIVREAQQCKRRSRLAHRLGLDAGNRFIDRPHALLGAQEDPMVQHVRLIRLHLQALRQEGKRRRIVGRRFVEPPEIVQCQQAEASLVGLVVRGVFYDPGPFRDGGIGQPLAFVDDAEVEVDELVDRRVVAGEPGLVERLH